jgi:hypothetical protein
MAHLLFKIDGTGSMKEWLNSITEILPSLIKSIGITNIFEKIGIIVYKDYDIKIDSICNFSGFYDSSNTKEINKLQDFAKNIEASGGAGTPEAVKTCIVEITKILKSVQGKTYIIHLTDAPPHELINLDSEGKKENTHLKTQFDWITLIDTFLQSNNNIRYMCLTTCLHSFYCYLAQKTNGNVYHMTEYITKANITKHLIMIFNNFLGIDLHLICKAYKMTDVSFKNEIELSNLIINKNSNSDVIVCPNLVSSMTNCINKMRFNKIFADYVICEFKDLIEKDIMAFIMSPILGKMWREFCKRRSDPRRDELLELFQKKKNKLNSNEKLLLEEWLKESYNSITEINEDICTFLENNDIIGLLRFVPDNEELCAQKIVQLLASGDKKSTILIRDILSRMYKDTDFKLEKQKCEEVVLPEKSIPLNLPSNKFAELIMHTVAPGTKLTRRYSAILACHAIHCGCVLQDFSEKYLEKIKGKWINWKIKEDGSPEVPENWSKSFLNLILHNDCVKFLTEFEYINAQKYKKISFLLTFYHNVEINVKIIDPKSIDSTYPDHMIKCNSCEYDRPLSLINESQICGYCCDYCCDSKKIDMQYTQLRCYSCGCIYSRDITVYVPGHNKCYACRHNLQQSYFTCEICNLNFVNWNQNINPKNKCGGCEQNLKPRVLQYIENTTLIHQLFKDHFKSLCSILGFNVLDTFTPNSGLYDAVQHILPKNELDAVQHILPKNELDLKIPNNILFRDSLVQNIEELWKYVLSIMQGCDVLLPECSVCLDLIQPSLLTYACGRKGCVQRTCNNCSNTWYNKNKPGNVIYSRATVCQFCCRIPNPKILGKINNQLIDLAFSIAKNELMPDKYYAWCKKCLKHDEIGDKICSVDIPNIQNYICKICKPIEFVEIKTKECPKCFVKTEKTSGCNHISCICGTHWCYECGKDCETYSNTYDHMHNIHGRIYEYEENNYYEDEDE